MGEPLYVTVDGKQRITRVTKPEGEEHIRLANILSIVDEWEINNAMEFILIYTDLTSNDFEKMDLREFKDVTYSVLDRIMADDGKIKDEYEPNTDNAIDKILEDISKKYE